MINQNYNKKIQLSGPNYPSLLKEIHKPPLELFYRGNLDLIFKPCISIVGTRKNTDYGEYVTEKIIKDLAVLDIAIVSGLAKGIDTIAHKMALAYNLPTIAVLGSGINNIYPKENAELANQIEKQGLILSEYPNNSEPINYHFIQRNRIISGLSLATIIIEAPEKSGALITADFAIEHSRDVFVVTGDIDREESRGCLKLLQQGSAYPITSGKDVIEVLNIQPLLPFKKLPNFSSGKYNICKDLIKKSNFYDLTQEEKNIFSLIPLHRSIDFDQIIKKYTIRSDKLLTILTILEMKGLIIFKNEKYRRTY